MIKASTGLVAVLLMSTDAEAFPVHGRLYRIEYGRPARCGLCHVSGGGTERTPYGRDWQQAGESRAAFSAIEARDSDGDGASNLEEISGGSNAGDAESIPSRPGRRWTTPEVSAIPSDQLQLVLADAEAFEAVDMELGADKIHTLERELGRRLEPEARYPTVYFGLSGGQRRGAALFVEMARPEGRYSLLVGVGGNARVTRIAAFRTGDRSGEFYAAHLRCLAGRGESDLPSPGTGGCPSLPGREATQSALTGSVRLALGTLRILFGRS